MDIVILLAGTALAGPSLALVILWLRLRFRLKAETKLTVVIGAEGEGIK